MYIMQYLCRKLADDCREISERTYVELAPKVPSGDGSMGKFHSMVCKLQLGNFVPYVHTT